MRNLLLVGAAALVLAACQKASDPAPGTPLDDREMAAAKAAAMASADDAAAQAAATQPASIPEPIAPPEPQWRFVRNERYQDYYLVQQSGPAVPGSQFEDSIMCRNVFEAAEENMWALTHLVITNTHPETTSFMGMIGSRIVEVTLVKNLDKNAPDHLMIGGLGLVGFCEQNLR